jgi:TrmH family RNA methyltransferase|tara:strand:- start:855 stop:1691 length:837 start_codon:yes stop_codon:yes gene_type:complete
MGDRMDVPLPDSNYELDIVLVGINHPGNLGAVCRTMLNHGFDQLSLVKPTCSIDDEEARNRAKHSGKILDNAKIFNSLEDSISDSSLVVGTSGKREVGSKVLKRHFVLPWEFAEKLRDFEGKVSLIFGEEGKGLSSEELDMCDILMTLPTWEGYPIANLSQAVGHCVYELHRDRVKNGKMIRGVEKTRAVTPELRQILKQAISEFSHSLDSEKNELIADVFDRVIMRGLPIDAEAERMIGSFVQATTALQKVSDDDEWKRDRRKRVTPSNSPKTSESP